MWFTILFGAVIVVLNIYGYFDKMIKEEHGRVLLPYFIFGLGLMVYGVTIGLSVPAVGQVIWGACMLPCIYAYWPHPTRRKDPISYMPVMFIVFVGFGYILWGLGYVNQ